MIEAIDGVIVGQVPAELDRLRELYLERAPKAVLEIGVFYGGTLREWLTHAAPYATVVAVDPEHQNPNLYEKWRCDDTTLIVGTGRSESAEMVELIDAHGPYDWAFIDGDHCQAAVDADVALARRLARPGGLMLLHDIAAENHPPTPPRLTFDTLRDKGLETWEIVEPPPDWYPAENGHGIGVVQL